MDPLYRANFGRNPCSGSHSGERSKGDVPFGYLLSKDKGLEIIGIALEYDGGKTLKRFAEEKKIAYPLAVGKESLAIEYSAYGVPARFLINRKGEIVEKFIGITGHHDPQILLEAMRRFTFDTVMSSVNAADRWYLPFKDMVIPEAVRQNMGIIAMKVLARGYLLRKDGIKTAKEAISYVLSLPVSVVIIGCTTPEEVEENVHIAKTFQLLSEEDMRHLESLTKGYFQDTNYLKAGI